MSVTISKFVRVMTDGKVVTKPLVSKLDAKLGADLDELERLRDKQRAMGLPVAQLTDLVATLRSIHVNAKKAPDNAAQCDMLETGRSSARRALSAARQRTPDGAWLDEMTALHTNLNALAQKNTTIPDTVLQKIAATKLAGLRAEQQNLLRNPPDLDSAQDLSKRVGSASVWSNSAVWFGSGVNKTDRELWRAAAKFYLREGQNLEKQTSAEKKAQGVELIALADSLEIKRVAVEKEAERNPRDTSRQSYEASAAYAKAKTLYEAAVLAPVLIPEVNKLIAENPNGSEAKMQAVLSPEEFEKRLLAVNNIAKAFGAPDFGKLSPGEAVALYSYTTRDYKAMNNLRNELTIPDDQKEREKIEIKIDTVLKAMAKLPASQITPLMRGEIPWPGAEARYVVGNEFTIKAFWSTSYGVKADGIWQITVRGTSGKNVAAFSEKPHESEILFPPGTKFRVKEVAPTGLSRRVVVEEIR